MEQQRDHAIDNARGWLETIRELAARMSVDPAGADEDAEVDWDDADKAREEAAESVLSVSVRDGWRAPGERTDVEAEEFEVLLSTGGPALRIYGTLDFGQADTFELQYQDWFKPWTDYPLSEEERKDVRTFLGAFWFGD